METQTIVITGLYGGVGKAIAELYLKKGWIVYGITRSPESIDINTSFGKYIEIVADIANYNDVVKAFESIPTRIDVLVNAAGVYIKKSFGETHVNDINNIIDTNLKGTMYVMQSALSKLKMGSRVINISSVAGVHGIVNESVYSASKFGLRGFTEAIAQEYKHILFTLISPGGIDTKLWNRNNIYPGNVDEILRPESIAKTVEYITSCPSNMIVKELTVFPNNEWH